MGEIYLLISPSGKYYVGQTKFNSYDRWKQHISDSKAPDGGRCRLLNNAIRKYGPDTFNIEIILQCDLEQLDYYEEKFIMLYNSNDSDFGYNLRSGGNLSNLSESTKNLMSLQRQLNPHFTQPHTEETKNKIRQTNINKTERKSHNDEILPKYVKYIKWVDREGYAIVSHPECKIKYFVSNKLSNDEKYNQCLEFLNNI